MPTLSFRLFLICVAAAVVEGNLLTAVEPVPVSLRATVIQMIGKTKVTIDYSRPSAKGREIFGALVPYDNVWRTGANEASTIAFDTEVLLGGQPVAAGRYALFSIPRADRWTIILNTVADQFGAFSYDATKDLVRFDAPVRRLGDPGETFEIGFTHVADNAARVELRWEDVAVVFPLTVTEASNRRMIEAEIERDVVRGGAPTWQNYGEAARHFARHDLDLEKAAAWFERCNELHPAAYWLFYEKARVLDRLNRRADAVAAVTAGIAAAAERGDQRGQEMGRELLAEWGER